MTRRATVRAAGPLPLSRRQFLGRCGALGAALVALPQALAEQGWLDEAAASKVDLTHDTFNGLVAFVTPGNDEYSAAQGMAPGGPGGIAAGATPAIIEAIDDFVPAPLIGGPTGTTLPASGGVAQLLNSYATQVNPAAARGGFVSAFARLSFEEKGEVFRRLQTEPRFEGTPIGYVAAVLPTLVALVAISDAPVLERGELKDTPLGWRLADYGGVSDGWDELKGYWRGRRSAANAHHFVRHRHGHRRRRGRRRA